MFKPLIIMKNIGVFLVANSFTALAFANPVLDNVGAGQVSISQTPNVTTINQSSSKAILNWQSFNIQPGQSTHFIQPVGGVALNRISAAQGASQIYGVLTATGKIILINPAGIYFGPGSFVNVGSIIATTANITDKNFLNGIYQFSNVNGYSGSIVNDGTIIAANHGLVALVGSNVTNNGYIQANLGHVVLAAGDAYTMSFAGNDYLSFAITKPTQKPKISNSGSIIANGGHILVSAASASKVLDNAINMSGVAQANSVHQQNGTIVISATPNAGIKVKGKLLANGKKLNETGGSIAINGGDILIGANSLLDVSGDAGAGNIVIGKDSQNKLAKSTVIESGVNLLANAITSGNGGQIETSGEYLNIGNNVNVNTFAANGITGSWLLDPTNLTITSSTNNVTQSGGIFTGNNNATTSSLDVATIINQLNNSNVIIQTTRGGTGSGAGNITVATNINWSTSFTLSLSAYRNIIINAGNTISNTNINSGLTLQANNVGDFNIGSGGGLVTNSGTIQMAGPVKIYYNPASTAYTPTVYTNTGAGALTAYMYINNATQLNILRNTSSLWGRNFALSTNVSAASISGFTPIGNITTNFTGKFDGLGRYIDTVVINGTTNAGLFGVTGATADIRNLTLYLNAISGTSNVGQLVGNNQGTIDGIIIVNGKVTGTGANVGGLAGLNSGTISNVENLGVVLGPNATNSVGGLVGQNTGTITNALSAGLVSGSTAGGLVGVNSATGNVQNSFWDTGTTGKSTGVSSNAHIFQATAGCYAGGACVNGGSANLTSATTYTNAGWNFTNKWGIISNVSYPYPLENFPTTPQVIAGQIGQFNNYYTNPVWANMADALKNPIWNSFAGLNLSNQQVDLIANGAWFDSSFSNANGTFYFLEPSKYLPTTGNFLLQLFGSANKANTLTRATTNNTSINNLPMALNDIVLAGNGTTNRVVDGVNYLSFTNTLFTNAVGYNPANTLFTVSGSDVTGKNGFSIVSAPGTSLLLTGNITTNNGSFTTNGILEILPDVGVSIGTRTITTTGSGNILLNLVNWVQRAGNPLDQYTLTLNAANNIVLNDSIFGYAKDNNGDVTKAGTLNLSAAFTNQSITTFPWDDVKLISLFNFNLLKGKWYQTGVLLPTGFSITNSFSINNGIMPTTQAEFIRVAGGAGTSNDPYLINDIYGLQGIGSDDVTLAAHWKRDASSFFIANTMPFWNNGAGFIPIGSIAQPFSGTFDGGNSGVDGGKISGILINRPADDNVGLFGVTSPTANIFNLAIIAAAITGKDNVGLIGYNQGTLNNVQVTNSFIVGENQVGVFAGTNTGTITNVSAFANRLLGDSIVGGVTGVNNGLINNAVIANYIGGNSIVGGLAGINNGLIQNSFWDTDVTGQQQSIGSNLGTGTQHNVWAGCILGYPFCTNGGSVKLSSPSSYLTTASGGLGLVSSDWDFANTWGILTGYSYPYQKALYQTPGSPTYVISGKLSSNAINELIVAFAGVTQQDLNGSSLGSLVVTKIKALITGADGSFYSLFLVPTDTPLALVAAGGNITGSIAFKIPGISVRNLTIPVTPNNNTPTNNLALSYGQVIGLFQGLTLDQIYSKLDPLTSGFHNLSQPLFVFQDQLAQYVNYQNINYFPQSYTFYYLALDNGTQLKVYTNVEQNIRDIMNGAKSLDNTLSLKYMIAPIKPARCGV